jgi:hypothetical protein
MHKKNAQIALGVSEIVCGTLGTCRKGKYLSNATLRKGIHGSVQSIFF